VNCGRPCRQGKSDKASSNSVSSCGITPSDLGNNKSSTLLSHSLSARSRHASRNPCIPPHRALSTDYSSPKTHLTTFRVNVAKVDLSSVLLEERPLYSVQHWWFCPQAFQFSIISSRDGWDGHLDPVREISHLPQYQNLFQNLASWAPPV